MNTFEVTQFNARAARISSADSEFEAWAFSIEEDRLILCCEEHTSVVLTGEEQREVRDAQSWASLIMDKGMMSPAAHIIGGWMASHQKSPKLNTISDGGSESMKED